MQLGVGEAYSVLGNGVEDRRIGLQFRVKRFSLLQRFETYTDASLSSCQRGPGALSLWTWPGHECEQPAPYFHAPPYAFMACCLITGTSLPLYITSLQFN